MALAASRKALAMANLALDPADIDSQRKIGIALGTGGGGPGVCRTAIPPVFPRRTKPLTLSITAGTHGNLSSELSIALGFRGLSHVLSTGCTSSTDALGYAALLIRSGATSLMLAGGTDAPLVHVASSPRSKKCAWFPPANGTTRPLSRPFSPSRWLCAWRRGVDVCAGRHRTCPLQRRGDFGGTGRHAPPATPTTACRSPPIWPSRFAPSSWPWHNARRRPKASRVYQSARHRHRSKRPHGNRRHIKMFGDQAAKIPSSTTKSMIGHPQGACGAAGFAATILTLRNGPSSDD